MTWRDIARLFERIELELVASLKRNLAAHRNWEKAEQMQWPAWQAEKLRNMNAFRRENTQIMQEYVSQIDSETIKMLEEQFAEGASEIPFFGVNKPRLNSLITDIQTVEKSAESAALRMMDDVYRKTILQAETVMSVGAVTLPKAIDMATQDFLNAGINCIRYKDGRQINITDYAQMALRTAATRAYLQGGAEQRAQLGIDTVLVSQYGACSETCLPWQGKVYIDDVWGDFKGEKSDVQGQSVNGKWYVLLSVAIKGGLFHPNCRHTLSTWYEGTSIMPAPLDGEKIRRTAKLEQKQRELEREVRKCKRREAGTQDKEQAKAYGAKVREKQKELREFIAKNNDVLRRDYWREKTYNEPITLANQPERGIILVNEDIALRKYVSSDAYALNDKLRERQELSPDEVKWVEDLDSALEKLPKYEGTVYRSISSEFIEDIEGFLDAHSVDSYVYYGAYTSSSIDIYDETMDIQIVIKSNSGKNLTGVNPNEQEILFTRNTTFVVTKVEGKKIWMEETNCG